MNQPPNRKVKHIDLIPDVLPAQAHKVIKDYQWSGAEVSSEIQPNGKVQVTAKFYENARYPASGISVLQR